MEGYDPRRWEQIMPMPDSFWSLFPLWVPRNGVRGGLRGFVSSLIFLHSFFRDNWFLSQPPSIGINHHCS